ncbi:uncharacterized protein LOC114806437 [Ornithorhynchus anatinus]|uniref:uncharacterized protein LOC114806437 n=1 Tax=Ornithorhynchus anatinus TaxID=9258 RepID=UPI0019D4C086|nr:uncharacterized protein LOC114806437 [Ornithorhynchus anatinus]
MEAQPNSLPGKITRLISRINLLPITVRGSCVVRREILSQTILAENKTSCGKQFSCAQTSRDPLKGNIFWKNVAELLRMHLSTRLSRTLHGLALKRDWKISKGIRNQRVLCETTSEKFQNQVATLLFSSPHHRMCDVCRKVNFHWKISIFLYNGYFSSLKSQDRVGRKPEVAHYFCSFETRPLYGSAESHGGYPELLNGEECVIIFNLLAVKIAQRPRDSQDVNLRPGG